MLTLWREPPQAPSRGLCPPGSEGVQAAPWFPVSIGSANPLAPLLLQADGLEDISWWF